MLEAAIDLAMRCEELLAYPTQGREVLAVMRAQEAGGARRL